jgi:hypothetical protein
MDEKKVFYVDNLTLTATYDANDAVEGKGW